MAYGTQRRLTIPTMRVVDTVSYELEAQDRNAVLRRDPVPGHRPGAPFDSQPTTRW